MGKRTVNSCWKQYEKLCSNYLQGVDVESNAAKLDELTKKVNNDTISAVLQRFFVEPHYPQPITIEFTTDRTDGIPQWQTQYDAGRQVLSIHPISVFRFYREIGQIIVPDRDDADMLRCRNLSFLSEISKLIPVHFLFLMVLQRVAYLNEIAHLEKRGGIVEVAEGEAYHTLLWAFKELETFVRLTQGVNIRAQYNISWYEADWITGR